MKVVLKLYSLSCVVLVAFFVFFSIPWEMLPFSDSVDLILVGLFLVSCAASYSIHSVRRDGPDLGWFLLVRGGFWVIALMCIGLSAVGCGLLLWLWPDIFRNAFEQGALPFGILLVSFFWLALIFLMGYPAFGMIALTAANVRASRFSRAIVSLLIGLICTALVALFFSLFLEVLNDILVRLATTVQWNAIWGLVTVLWIAGIIYGFLKVEPDPHIEDPER